MFKLYNTQSQITSALSNFFNFVSPNSSKPHIKNSSDIIFGIIKSESVVTSDIVKSLKSLGADSQPSSVTRRFERFFNNTKFYPYSFFESIISYIIKNYKIKNPNVYISFDHMFCKDNFTVFMLSLRIGKQRHSFMVPLFQR